MCGRYVLLRPDIKELMKRLHLESLYSLVVTESRFNIGPGQRVLAVRRAPEGDEASSRAPETLHWGMRVPSPVAPGKTNFLINARGETLTRRPSFRDAFRHRRCAIPASGFYEWDRKAGTPQPHLFRRAGGEPFFLAGIWDPVVDGVDTCVVITTAPNALLSRIHDRMPVMLGEAEAEAWIGAGSVEQAQALIKAFPAEGMTAQRVGPAVNNIRNEGESLWAPPPAEPPEKPKDTGPEQLGLF
jgi:putative SOS response-associated peptidase YedK